PSPSARYFRHLSGAEGATPLSVGASSQPQPHYTHASTRVHGHTAAATCTSVSAPSVRCIAFRWSTDPHVTATSLIATSDRPNPNVPAYHATNGLASMPIPKAAIPR